MVIECGWTESLNHLHADVVFAQQHVISQFATTEQSTRASRHDFWIGPILG